MNRFLRDHILSDMMNPALDVNKGYFTKDEEVQTQIKFLRDRFNTITSLAEFNLFVKYVEDVIERNNLKLGTKKKLYMKQCIALIIFLDTLEAEKNRPKILRKLKFKSIMRKFKPILIKAYVLGVKLMLEVVSSEMIISFIDLVYNTSASAQYIPKTLKDTCLHDITCQYLTKIHMYDYIAKNIDSKLITCYDNLLSLVVWQDEELCTYSDFPHWKEFQKLLRKTINKIVKSNNSPLDAIRDNLAIAMNDIAKSITMKNFLNILYKKVENRIKYIERAKKKIKANTTISTDSISKTIWVNNPITTTCIDNVATKSEVEELKQTIVKQEERSKGKIKLNGGY